MLKGNFEPGFYIKHFIKDMKIALEEAEANGDGSTWTWHWQKSV